ncbi:M60 family metallopeptidase [Enterobacter kobei]|uniref:M60 family metallopeptidase n=1 Tax=Enterobacter kobei TaxID=208224 RepID=UPI002FD76F3F
MAAMKLFEQISSFPVARVQTYNNLVVFDTYVANSSTPSQNEDDKLIVKKDESYGPGHRISYLGFNAERLNIPNIIGSLTLRLHPTNNDKIGNVSVYFVPDDSFWNTTFKYTNRPHASMLINTFSTSDTDADGWLTIDISNSEVIAKFRKDGHISLALMGEKSLVYHEFSSSKSPEHSPLLQLSTANTEINPSNSVRYVSFSIISNTPPQQILKISEFNVINSNGVIVDRSKWRVTNATNMDGWNKMFDGIQGSFWKAESPVPNFFVVDLFELIDIKAIVYTPVVDEFYEFSSDLLVYGSNDGNSWYLIGSRAIDKSENNSPHIIFTGSEATLTHVEKTYSFPIKTAWDIEVDRLKNKAGRSPLNVTQLCFNQPGIVCIWVGDEEAKADDFLEAREGQWDGSERHRLRYGLNCFRSNLGNPLYLQIASKSSLDNSRVAYVKIMASNALFYPVFITRQTEQSDWLSMIENYSSTNYFEMISNRIILGINRLHFEPFKNVTNMQELADTYDECLIPTELAAGIRDNDHNPMHRPDVNPYYFVPSSSGFMTTYVNRITYHLDLTKRMVTPNEVRTYWGIWHEVGHNLQTTGLNWSGQQEVSVNIYAFGERAYSSTLDALIESYDKSFSNSFNALKNVDSYTQLSNSNKENLFHHLFFIFGEGFMYDLHRRYRENLSGNGNDPEFSIGATADEQMNTLAIISSKISSLNLVDFYIFWKFPLTNQTINSIGSYNFNGIKDFEKLPSALVKRNPDNMYDMRF